MIAGRAGRCGSGAGRAARSLHAMVAVALSGVAATQEAPVVTLSGRVVDMRGEAVPVAEVWVEPRGGGKAWRTRADGEGFYRLTVPRIPSQLFARAEGRCCVVHTQREPFPPQYIVLHEAATLRGVLKDKGGLPVQKAVVFAQRQWTPSQMVAQATTDERGGFVLPGVALGPTCVVAWIDGEGMARTRLRVVGDAEVRLESWSGPTTALLVTLRDVPAADWPRVTLTLTASLGNLSLGGRPEWPAPFFRRGVPADGWRVEHLPDVEWIVAPYADGVRFRPSVVGVASGSGPHTIELVAKWPASTPTTVRAIVRDGERQPIPGLRVGFYGSNVSSRLDAATDVEGRLTIESPWAVDQPTFFAQDDRWLDRLSPAASGIQGSSPSVIELLATAGCEVKGRVLAPAGSPAGLARVRLERPEARGPGRVLAETWTDADGSFALRRLVADDQVRLVITGDHGLLVHEDVATGTVGTTTSLGDLRLGLAAVVEGVVRDAAGAPAAGAVVRLGAEGKLTMTGLLRAEAATDSRGRFRFLGVPSGGVNLMLWPEDAGVVHPETAFQVEAGSTHTVELQERQR